MARRGSVGRGAAWRGLVRHGKVFSTVSLKWLAVDFRHGMAERGEVVQGQAGRGQAGQGKVFSNFGRTVDYVVS